VKAVLLAGGYGTRITEESATRPKPLIEIGGRPILWHIMKIYAAHGITEFIVCLGYKGYMIKEFFANYRLHTADVTFHLREESWTIHRSETEDWTVTLVDTGEGTMTGGRLRRVRSYLEGGGTFCFTYGDGVADIDLTAEIAHHRAHGRLATVAAVIPPGRYGSITTDEGGFVTEFTEKPPGDGGSINGGFFVLEPGVFDYLRDDATIFESEPLERLAADRQLATYRHEGFWQPLDTLRDKIRLEQMWENGRAPWRVW
jgi:glucose-1-phosphate cytidylyltransferase